MRIHLTLLMISSSLFASWDGQGYDQNSRVQTDHASAILGQVLDFEGDELVLDIGSGNGKTTALCAARLPHGRIIGLDPSESMNLKAHENVRELTNVEIREGRAESFNFREHFDTAISIHALHWVEAQEAALANIARHLKPGGKVRFIMAASKEGLAFDVALRATRDQWASQLKTFRTPQQFWEAKEYRQLMKKAGLHANEIRYIHRTTSFDSKEQLTNYIVQWLPEAQALPEPLRQPFMQQLIDRFVAEQNGSLDWSEYVMLVLGHKPVQQERGAG